MLLMNSASLEDLVPSLHSPLPIPSIWEEVFCLFGSLPASPARWLSPALRRSALLPLAAGAESEVIRDRNQRRQNLPFSFVKGNA